jgi:hypothetical protein
MHKVLNQLSALKEENGKHITAQKKNSIKGLEDAVEEKDKDEKQRRQE